MGLNFYGRDFSRSGMKDVLGHDYNASLERKGAVLHWDEAYQEHKLTYKDGSEEHMTYYPSTTALQVGLHRQYSTAQGRLAAPGLAAQSLGCESSRGGPSATVLGLWSPKGLRVLL